MIRHKQLIEHDPDNGQFGDCMRTCIASVLELDVLDVPHFYENGLDIEEGNKKLDEWFKSRGLLLIEVPIISIDGQSNELPLKDALKTAAFWSPGSHMLLTGESGNFKGVNHVVVIKDGEIVHDPSGSGIAGPAIHEEVKNAYWISIFAKDI